MPASLDPILAYKKTLETFFLQIHKISLDLSHVVFPEIKGFSHYMVVPPKMATGTIYAGFVKVEMPASCPQYMGSITTKDKKQEQPRPKEMYVFSHKGDKESEKEHKGKSYKTFTKEGVNYMNVDEYMLCCQFMWWAYKVIFDEKGCTTTATMDTQLTAIQGFNV